MEKITNTEVSAESILVTDELTESEWLQLGATNSVFDFLADPEEDIYTLEDGKPFEL